MSSTRAWIVIGGLVAFAAWLYRRVTPAIATPIGETSTGLDAWAPIVTGSVADMDLSNDPASTGYPSSVYDLANAIAVAEGYGVAGAIPTRANNPGDLVVPGWSDAVLGDQGIAVFPDVATGWDALYRQLDRIRTNRSHVYNLAMTITDMGNKWAPGNGSTWAANVARSLQAKGYSVWEGSALGDFLI